MRRYLAHVADSRRWQTVRHRDDDIVISTPSKCGTTWMQMLVALLVFDDPSLPAPLSELSPWVDMRTLTAGDLAARLERMAHRRFLKTHVPLDGLPLDDRVTYIVVGRDPRDAWASMERQGRNLDLDAVMRLRVADHDEEVEDFELPDDPRERFRAQLRLPVGTNHTDAHLAQVVHHLSTGWARREQPNVLLFHYADLEADRLGQLQRLAEELGVPRSAGRLRELAEAASLERMRHDAGRLAPDAAAGIWRDPADFFGGGTRREWLAWTDAEADAEYARRVHELTGGDEAFARWLHHGGI